MNIVGLTCEYLCDPIGVGVDNPRLGWRVDGKDRNYRQSAYRILVSSNKENAEMERGDLWDTGKIQSSSQNGIQYQGIKLKSGQQCWWRVKCWDPEERSLPWSGITSFETGLLQPEDWKGKWIGGPDQSSGLVFGKNFSAAGKVRSARAYICGLGYYELVLNGNKVGDHVLDPGWTDYGERKITDLLYPFEDKTKKRVLYVTYDVTKLINSGENAVGVMLGNGWYNQHERNVEGKMRYGEPRFILQLNVEYEDGRSESIISDTSWTYRQGPVVFNYIYFGETYDARLELDDRSEMGNAAVIERTAPGGSLISQMSPPDRVVGEIRPLSVKNPVPGIFVADMGRNFSGWVRLMAEGPAGTEIRLRFAEEVDAEGLPDFESAGGKQQIQCDTYRMKGKGMEVYEPRFTWHTFRYVEVSGYPGVPGPDDIIGRVVHSDMKRAGSFECSDPLINQINEMYVQTQYANFHGGVPSDCPHRERLGYTGDGQITAEACIYNFDMASFYSKWIEDIADAQNQETGFVPHTAPFYGGGGGPAWGCAYILNTWCMYLYYGDRDILGKHYDGMKKWLDYLESKTQGVHVIRMEEPGGWFLGDWCTPEGIRLPPELVSTFYYLKCAEMMVLIAGLLGRTEDSDRYRLLCPEIKKAFNTEFYNREAGRYSIGSQGADVFPLAGGIVDEDCREKVLESLLENLKKTDFHFDTGIFGTPLLLDVLAEYNLAELACKVLTQKGYPGYVHMLDNGATTLWEYWDGSNSHCHPMFGSVSAWFYKTLAGIQADPAYPGFERILFKPGLSSGLQYVKASLDSIRGRIEMEWHRTEQSIEMNVVVPPNSSAVIQLCGIMNFDFRMIKESGKLIFDCKGDTSFKGDEIKVTSAASKPEILVEIGSGHYKFELV